ncbi:MAG: sugar phosphate isomerase/epimerase family protein [Fimbriimonadaceae bacterium]
MYPVSIQLYTVRQYLETEGRDAILKHIARAGYDAIEAGDVGSDPAAYLRRVQDLGMTVSSWFGPFPDAEHLNQVIETAKALQVENVVCGFWIPDFESVEAITRTAEKLRGAVKAVHDAGLNLCLHNHWFEFDLVEGHLAMDRLLNSCPGLKLELDVYWASNFGAIDVPTVVRTRADCIHLLHVKDGPLVKGEPQTALGQGKLDLPSIIQAADPNVLKWLVVELDECATDMWTAVEESVAYLRRVGLAAPRV